MEVLHGKKVGVSIKNTINYFMNIRWLHYYDGDHKLSHNSKQIIETTAFYLENWKGERIART